MKIWLMFVLFFLTLLLVYTVLNKKIKSESKILIWVISVILLAVLVVFNFK